MAHLACARAGSLGAKNTTHNSAPIGAAKADALRRGPIGENSCLAGAEAAAYGGENNSKMNAELSLKTARDRRRPPLKGGAASAQGNMVT
jgi:hypothetical protein